MRVLLLGLLVGVAQAGEPEVRVGSKRFTENVVLGEVLTQLAERTGHSAHHQPELGGTRILWNAMLAGEIDAYPDYTGTLLKEILAEEELGSEAELPAALEAKGVGITGALGFNNTYAMGMRADRARELGIERISQLRDHPDLFFGLGDEFLQRGDGWPALQARYDLPQTPRGLDHDLAYRALDAGDIDLMDLYSTDAEIGAYDIAVLADDLGHFPRYEAVVLYRLDLGERLPEVVAAWQALAGSLDEAEMIALNKRARLDKVPAREVAADWLDGRLGAVARTAVVESRAARVWRATKEHLVLVGVSLVAAVMLSLPLGVLGARRPRLGRLILGVVGVLQTIPSLALLVVLIPFLGIGAAPAMFALFLYSLLPIVRNTTLGIQEIPRGLRASAEVLGLSSWQRLRFVELPLASPAILAGVRTAAVINVGTATLGAIIGAGGYGQAILTGIRLDDLGLILEGALPAAALALAVEAGFTASEWVLVPRGLRLQRSLSRD